VGSASLGADRSQIAALTEDPGDGEPQASPDGRLIVFARSSNPEEPYGDAPETIYVIGTDGTGLRAITDGAHRDREPSFSPSGKRIYFTRASSGYSTDVFSVALGGGTPSRITSGNADDFHPQASSRGGLLTFERRVVRGTTVTAIASHHVYISRADGSQPRDLTPKLSNRYAAMDPEFSPDGRRIAYSIGDRLISVRIDGSRPRRLFPRRGKSDQALSDPTYAPDGRSLIFTVSDSRSHLQRIDLSTLRPLPTPLAQPHLAVREPAWLAVPR
jgi:Tol biopolymer transport system component